MSYPSRLRFQSQTTLLSLPSHRGTYKCPPLRLDLPRFFSIWPPAYVETSQTYQIPNVGKLRISLKSKNLFGVAQSRGERNYQEDCVTISSVRVATAELKKTLAGLFETDILDRHKSGAVDAEGGGIEQALFVGVFDGHGGVEAADYLQAHLARLVEDCDASDIPEVIRTYRTVGGYFRRFRGGLLEDLGGRMYAKGENIDVGSSAALLTASGPKRSADPMCIGERLTLAFLKADQHLISKFPKAGAVGTVAVIQPLPAPDIYPFYSSPAISLSLGHVGDTIALLCSSKSGKAVSLTETHHADSRVEAERLRRIGTGLITDSFGESRWGGTLANTRGLGDSGFKSLGVTGEPDIVKKVLKGKDWAFMVIVSDGVTDVMSKQEIVDLCRDQRSPTTAAKRIINFAEQLGGRDNMSAVVVPFAGWGNTGGSDLTADRREFRLRQVSSQSSRQRRM
ncbi:hypothetical protein CROQUDRAFT_37318 [Cronartium quercuum f. sp. fusiforme G11]|uniref:PPM-type phosphatase domain-containing protein n=1 Tax=Cronartium quercuum f. sp. fusiforme G11 TaxID=708437 RepID=A0A9P6NPS3_9BASI|nr:hypothetical protein CROQUDRAFT_37318 [Cronartium quercuum f. sp. fusiforme G11]